MVAQGLPQLLESHGMAREMLEDGLGRFFVIRVRGQVPVVDHLDPAWIVRNEPLLFAMLDQHVADSSCGNS